jgi:hypothetical protein
LLFETGKIFDKELGVAKITADASGLRGTSTATSGKFSVAELVIFCCYNPDARGGVRIN